MRIELLRPSEPDQLWRVMIQGEIAVAFSGPDAEQRAEHCYLELNMRLAEPGADEEDASRS